RRSFGQRAAGWISAYASSLHRRRRCSRRCVRHRALRVTSTSRRPAEGGTAPRCARSSLNEILTHAGRDEPFLASGRGVDYSRVAITRRSRVKKDEAVQSLEQAGETINDLYSRAWATALYPTQHGWGPSIGAIVAIPVLSMASIGRLVSSAVVQQ